MVESSLTTMMSSMNKAHIISSLHMADPMSFLNMAQSTPMSKGPKQATTNDLECYADFSKRFTKKKVLGQGTDGEVVAWVDSDTDTLVAVKTPRKWEFGSQIACAKRAIKKEILLLKTVGTHENVVGMLASCKDFEPVAPAIFFEVCDLGDLQSYWMKWFNQQDKQGLSVRIPEATLFKFLHDMILALDFLHNHQHCWVHADIKPENILVVTPPTYTGGDITDMPTFKLADLGRMVEYPNPANHVPNAVEWPGTYEFAPPVSERPGAIKPAADIWGLGATMQTFALGITPVIARETFIYERVQAKRTHPRIDDNAAWKSDYWRAHRQVVYRPLSATKGELVEYWDVDDQDREFGNLMGHKPYSKSLNEHYRSLLEPDRQARVTAKFLKKYVVPVIELQIREKMHLGRAQECFKVRP